ncbi:MAG: hypothetical protein ACI8WB_004382 [Phenylobacterium sp.]
MRKIAKNDEPEHLTKYKRQNPNNRYKDISNDEGLRQSIREACTAEQFYLCAYCCDKITGENDSCHNEHIEAQKLANTRTLDYSNIVASCNAKNQCGHKHGHTKLELTPLMDACETELKFETNGLVVGTTPRAQACIDILNLGDTAQSNRRLVSIRKQMIEALLFDIGLKPYEQLEDDELLAMVITELNTPIKGELASFSPVLVAILNDQLLSI